MWAWIFGIVGALGVTGAIALFFLGPAAVLLFLRAVLAIFTRLWATRPGMALIVALATGSVGYLAGHNDGETRVRAAWTAANAIAAERAREVDAEITKNAETAEARDVVVEVEADKENAEARNAYVAELEKRAAAVCRVDDADLKRLHDIR